MCSRCLFCSFLDHLQKGAGRPDRHEILGSFEALRISSPGVLDSRGTIDLQTRQADPSPRRRPGAASVAAAIGMMAAMIKALGRGGPIELPYGHVLRLATILDRRRGNNWPSSSPPVTTNMPVINTLTEHTIIPEVFADVAKGLGTPSIETLEILASRLPMAIQPFHAREM